MRYELKLAKFIEKGSSLSLSDDLPVEVLAVMGRLGSLHAALKAIEGKARDYPFTGDQAAVIIRVPLKLMETVVALNKTTYGRGADPLELVKMLREGHLGKWRRNGLDESFVSVKGSFPISRAAKFH